jgi:TonB family protein
MKIDLFGDASNQPTRASYKNEFALTIISDALLSQRLFGEISFVIGRVKRAWPQFKEHPVRTAKHEAKLLGSVLRASISAQTVLAAITSIALVLSVALTIVMLDQRAANRHPEEESDGVQLVTTLSLAATPTEESDPGVGAGQGGRVGFRKGGGEGSRPDSARARGGGGGGNGSQLPASLGRIPIPSIIPAPIPTAAVKLPQTLPHGGIDLDSALWRKLDYSQYGDPRSKSTTPSNGPGEGGGVGTNRGTGIGEGDGPGVFRGKGGNMGDGEKNIGGRGEGGATGNKPDDDPHRVYKSPEVSTRPRVISKPEPQYTEQARRDGTTGTVVLRVVFSSTGQVTNIVAVQKLGNGLTENAIAAARQIRFHPATRNGQPVSMFVQLEYNFNLY